MSATTTSSGTPAKAPDTRGLAGQTVGDTAICAVTQTQLIYRGYEIADLAEHATFEEVAFLLLEGHKPSAAELARFKAEIVSMRAIPEGLKALLREIVTKAPRTHPMSVLRTGISYLSHFDPECEDHSPAAELRKSKRLLAQIPTIIGHGQMVLDGKTPVEPDASLSHSANLLWCVTGRKPTELQARVMDVSLILYAEHDFNASTFACRVIASTETDMHSAVCGGIGALKGPLHGGANEMAMEMLKDLDRDLAASKGAMNVEQWMQRAFAEKPFRMLMHCYTGGERLAQRAAALGAWFSVSGILSFKAAGDVRQVIAGLPLERIILETDCPYLAPVPNRGRRCEPAYVKDVAKALADLRGITLEEAADVTTRNALRLFERVS
jgi:citrate synthase